MTFVHPSDSEQTNLTDTWSTDTSEDDGESAQAPTQRLEFDAEGNVCQFCETVVTRQFARIFGDNQNTVHCCQDCATFRELQDGRAAHEGYIPDDGDEVTRR